MFVKAAHAAASRHHLLVKSKLNIGICDDLLVVEKNKGEARNYWGSVWRELRNSLL